MRGKRKLRILPLILAFLVIQVAPAPAEDYPNGGILVETRELQSELGDPALRIVDLRDPAAYGTGHIPGAVNLNTGALEDIESNKEGYPLPVDRAVALFESLGIDQRSRVVGYDDSGGRAASRLFYVLEFLGHRDVRVLNGGITKWQREGRLVATGGSDYPSTRFEAIPNKDVVATAESIRLELGNPWFSIIDARSAAEFSGADVRARRGGHIPGAVHIDWFATIVPESKVFRSPGQLKEIFSKAGVGKDNNVVVYCQSGMRAAQLYFVARLMGYEKVSLYDASWQEWGNRTDLPIES